MLLPLKYEHTAGKGPLTCENIRTVRTECLVWMLILGRRHLELVVEGSTEPTECSSSRCIAWCSAFSTPGSQRIARS